MKKDYQDAQITTRVNQETYDELEKLSDKEFIGIGPYVRQVLMRFLQARKEQVHG
jgi:hypothetical protein